MPEVLHQLEINANRKEVFQLAQDYNLRLEWDSFLVDLKFLSDNKTLEEGLEVWVKAKNGMEMTVEYISFSSPSHVSMKMIEGPFFFNHFSGVWKFTEKDNNCTSVIFKYKFQTKHIFKLGNWLIKYRLGKDMKHRLQALKDTCEDGKLFNKLSKKS